MHKQKHYLRGTLAFLLLSYGFSESAFSETDVHLPATKLPLTKAQAILDFLDKGKNTQQPFQLNLKIIAKKDGKQQQYLLKDDGKTNTVLEFLDKRQRGQKVLSTENEVWFFAKRTRRAIKIPPIQKLYGDANIGDISRLRYAADYDPVAVSSVDGGFYVLELKSKSRAATYHRILLRVNKSDYLPVVAALFSASGKHVKSARFIDTLIEDDVPTINTWELWSPSQPDKVTRVESSNFRFIDASPVEFTKSYLALKR